MSAGFFGYLLGMALTLSACGAKTAGVDDDVDAANRPVATPERCNLLDDDLDQAVDEDFRDEAGRYVHDEHCGGCDRPCAALPPNATGVACQLVGGAPACAATGCEAGFTVSRAGGCTPAFDHLCLECTEDGDCGLARSARCALLGSESRCVVGCEAGCPEGYRCAEDQCIPVGGSCSCGPGDVYTLACALVDPQGERCIGSAACAEQTNSK